MSQKKKKSHKDPYFRLKYMGYCMSQLPPDGALTEFDDWVRYAKFVLCREAHVLMKDPIWDDYTDEEILIEYYALILERDQNERAKFESMLAGQSPDIVDWFDDMIEKNKEDLDKIKKRMEEAEDEVSFSPDSLGE